MFQYKRNAIVFPNVGGTATVTIELQIPYVCNGGENFQCKLDFEVIVTDGFKKVCDNKPSYLGMKYQSQCKTSVNGLVPGRPNPTTKQRSSKAKLYILR